MEPSGGRGAGPRGSPPVGAGCGGRSASSAWQEEERSACLVAGGPKPPAGIRQGEGLESRGGADGPVTAGGDSGRRARPRTAASAPSGPRPREPGRWRRRSARLSWWFSVGVGRRRPSGVRRRAGRRHGGGAGAGGRPVPVTGCLPRLAPRPRPVSVGHLSCVDSTHTSSAWRGCHAVGGFSLDPRPSLISVTGERAECSVLSPDLQGPHSQRRPRDSPNPTPFYLHPAVAGRPARWRRSVPGRLVCTCHWSLPAPAPLADHARTLPVHVWACSLGWGCLQGFENLLGQACVHGPGDLGEAERPLLPRGSLWPDHSHHLRQVLAGPRCLLTNSFP